MHFDFMCDSMHSENDVCMISCMHIVLRGGIVGTISRTPVPTPCDSVVGTTRQTQSLGQPGRLCSSAAPSVDSIILRCEVVSTTANSVGCNIEGRRSLHNVFQLRLFCCSEASSAPSSAAGPTLSPTSLPCHFYPISIICK